MNKDNVLFAAVKAFGKKREIDKAIEVIPTIFSTLKQREAIIRRGG